MNHDTVDAVLESLKLQSSIFCRMELSGGWGFDKPALQGAPFYLVSAGELWVEPPGEPAVRAGVGDMVILPRGSSHVIRSGPEAPVIAFKPLLVELGWAAWTPGMRYKTGVLTYGVGDGAVTTLVAGVFGFEDRRGNPLLRALPEILHLKRADLAGMSESWFGATTQLLQAEVNSGQPGSGALAVRLADIIFVQAVRRYLQSHDASNQGWLRGIKDAQIGRSLSLMHAHPERRWTVAELAGAVGMSRARFAARFQDLVGRGPLDYLTRWRMYEAAGQLGRSDEGLASLAARSGYTSEMAFSKAFKRWLGYSPSEFRRRTLAGEGTGALEDTVAPPLSH